MTQNNSPSITELSEEVQEVLYLAKKAAAKNSNGLLQDHHFLKGLFQINRLFTRLDTLLKYSGIPPRRLKKLYTEETSKLNNDNSTKSTVLERAREIANVTEIKNSKLSRVEIEHLLIALSQSDDPVVKNVFNRGELKADRIKQAIPQVAKESLSRFIFYCIRETLEVIVVVVLMVIMIKQGLGEFRLIPSESMVPTLQVGDRILVEKVSHWYRQTQRGDILVFYPPEPESILRNDPLSIFFRLTGLSGIVYNRESPLDRAFIKRVVGLPGDIVEVKPGDGVYINNQKLDEPYVNEIADTCTLINYCGQIKVPEDMYYMMGDNRNRSSDSRVWQFLPKERVVGRAVLRFYPLDERIGMIH